MKFRRSRRVAEPGKERDPCASVGAVVARAGITASIAPKEEQREAPLLVAAGTIQKPHFPSDGIERAGPVFAALLAAPAPLDALALARNAGTARASGDRWPACRDRSPGSGRF